MPPKRPHVSRTDEDRERAREAVRRLGCRTRAADELGMPRSTLIEFTRDLPGNPLGGGARRPAAPATPPAGASPATPAPPPEPVRITGSETDLVEDAPPTPVEMKVKGDEATASFTADRLIRTEAEALAYAEIDTSVWQVKSMEIKYWTTTMKLRGGQDADGRRLGDTGHVKQNSGITLKLARILSKPYMDAAEAIFRRMADYAPRYPAIKYARPKAPALLIVDLFDVHFGKLAWRRETGEDYDLKIAERIFAEALEDILSEASGRDIERIIVPAGNDFFHIDGLKNETTAGTPQDTDGRFHKIIEVGEVAMIKAIERARGIAPVQLLHIPGNHDRTASWNMARTIWAWFHNCPDVTVDLEPKARKYIAYNRNLVAFTHGNEEKVASLPIIMASEERQMWAETDYAEWHLGHRHTKGQTETISVGDHDGVKVRRLQSLSGRDAWHYLKGYGCGKRAAEAFLYDSKTGNVNGIEVSLRRAS